MVALTGWNIPILDIPNDHERKEILRRPVAICNSNDSKHNEYHQTDRPHGFQSIRVGFSGEDLRKDEGFECPCSCAKSGAWLLYLDWNKRFSCSVDRLTGGSRIRKGALAKKGRPLPKKPTVSPSRCFLSQPSCRQCCLCFILKAASPQIDPYRRRTARGVLLHGRIYVAST